MLIAVVVGNVCDALEEAGISDVFVRDIRGCRSQAAQISSLASSHGGAERIGCDEDESKKKWNIFFIIFFGAIASFAPPISRSVDQSSFFMTQLCIA